MKNGFTLIEVITAASIALIIALSCIVIYGKATVNYQNGIVESRDESSVMQAFLFIQNELEGRVKNVELVENKLLISLTDNVNTELILFKSTENGLGNIQIQYIQLGHYLSTNNIITNVKSLTIEKEDNLVYISIVDKGGLGFERCFSLKK
jgi:prepilin-type N-terminal cleavage/methylation domain-containing protein